MQPARKIPIARTTSTAHKTPIAHKSHTGRGKAITNNDYENLIESLIISIKSDAHCDKLEFSEKKLLEISRTCDKKGQ